MDFRLAARQIALIAVLAGAGHPAWAALRTSYRVELSTGSWQPINPADLTRALEERTLDVLTSQGLLRLEREAKATSPADGKGSKELPDLRIEIRGRMLDEAETFTAYVSISPERAVQIDGLAAAETSVLSGLARPAMLEAVERAAKTAATKLMATLVPRLKAVAQATSGGTDGGHNLADEPLPFSWPKIRVPSPSEGRASKDLYSKDRPTRMAALRELTSLALSQSSMRNVLETCTLRHFDPETKLGCLVALRPSSRRVAATQTVVIEVLRTSNDRDLENEASAQMVYFTGASRIEAIQAWLEATSKGFVFEPMKLLGDVPNLDIAIARCIVATGKRPEYQRSHRACIELLGPLSHARRRAILWRSVNELDPKSPLYLEGAGDAEGRIGTEWQWAVEALLDRATSWDPALEEVLWRRYQRTMSETAVRVLSEYGPPTDRLASRLLEILQTAGGHYPLSGLKRIAEASGAPPELRSKIREKLAELLHTQSYPKSLRADQLERVIEELGRKETSR